MAGDTTNLGKAVITVEVDSSKVASGMQQAQQQAQGAAGGISGPGAFGNYGGSIAGLNYDGSTGGVIGPGSEQVTAKMEQQSRAADKLGSSMLGLRQAFNIGAVAATGMFLAVSKLSDIFGTLAKGTKQANDEFVRGIASQNTMSERISSLSGASTDLTDKFTRLTENSNIYSATMSRISLAWNDGIYSSGQLADRIQAVNKELSDNQKIREQAIKDDAAAKEKADFDAKLEDQRDARFKAMDDEKNKRLADEEEVTKKIIENDEKVEAERKKASDEQYERDLKNAERIADAVEKAFTRAIQSTRDRSAGLFNIGEITNSIDLIGQKLDAIARNTRSRM